MHTFTFKGLTRGLFSAALLGFLSVSQAAGTGLLWKLEAPSGTVSYIFGTIHVDDPRVTEFSPTLIEAVKQSDIFMMETLPPSDPSLYFLPDYNLKDVLTGEEWKKAQALADMHAMHEENMLHMKPWLLAMIFDLPEPQSPFTQDVLLYTQANEQGKEIQGLEDAREHFTMLDSLSRDEQMTILRTVLGHSQAEKERDYESLLQAYLTGDLSAIASIDEKTTSSMLPAALWQKMRARLIDDRNATMASRIAQQGADHKLFVAVGAAHLAGENGILARLRKAGYKVSKVN